MAKSAAERKRISRERAKREDIISAKPDDDVFRMPFFEFFNRRTDGFSDWSMHFDMAGLEAPEIKDDSDPKSLLGDLEQYELYKGYKRSVGRAEIMLSALLDATGELARIINDYKRSEITERVHEIEALDLSDPEVRKKALADMLRLQRMLEQLDKQVRWTFPQWRTSRE